MHLHRFRTTLATAVTTACFGLAVPPAHAKAIHDLISITTYEALLDTFRAYPDSPGVRRECLQAMGYMKDSMKVSPEGHENEIRALISQGIDDTLLWGETFYQIFLFQLNDYEDTIFTFSKPVPCEYFGALARIGGHRTTEFFKEIIQRYRFDKYEHEAICALGAMKDSAFYLIPDIKKYRDSLLHLFEDSCPLPLSQGPARCRELSEYEWVTKYKIEYLEDLQRQAMTATAKDVPCIPANPVPPPNGKGIPEGFYAPDGRLIQKLPATKGVYIKDGRIMVNQGAEQ